MCIGPMGDEVEYAAYCINGARYPHGSRLRCAVGDRVRSTLLNANPTQTSLRAARRAYQLLVTHADGNRSGAADTPSMCCDSRPASDTMRTLKCASRGVSAAKHLRRPAGGAAGGRHVHARHGECGGLREPHDARGSTCLWLRVCRRAGTPATTQAPRAGVRSDPWRRQLGRFAVDDRRRDLAEHAKAGGCVAATSSRCVFATRARWIIRCTCTAISSRLPKSTAWPCGVRSLRTLRSSEATAAHSTWRFIADSPPGRWVLHCHNEIHMVGGMMTEVVYD